MDVTTKAFHDLIVHANRCHKAFNQHGPAAAAYGLRSLREGTATLIPHLASLEEARQKEQK